MHMNFIDFYFHILLFHLCTDPFSGFVVLVFFGGLFWVAGVIKYSAF